MSPSPLLERLSQAQLRRTLRLSSPKILFPVCQKGLSEEFCLSEETRLGKTFSEPQPSDFGSRKVGEKNKNGFGRVQQCRYPDKDVLKLHRQSLCAAREFLAQVERLCTCYGHEQFCAEQ